MASASAKCKDHEYEICVWEYERKLMKRTPTQGKDEFKWVYYTRKEERLFKFWGAMRVSLVFLQPLPIFFLSA